MDKTQINAFVDYMIGWRTIAATEQEEFNEPICREMRAFVLARLGEKTPLHGYEAVRNVNDCGSALAALLYEVANGLGAAEGSLDHAQRLIASLLKSNDAQDCNYAEWYLKRFRPDLAAATDEPSEGPFGPHANHSVAAER